MTEPTTIDQVAEHFGRTSMLSHCLQISVARHTISKALEEEPHDEAMLSPETRAQFSRSRRCSWLIE